VPPSPIDPARHPPQRIQPWQWPLPLVTAPVGRAHAPKLSRGRGSRAAAGLNSGRVPSLSRGTGGGCPLIPVSPLLLLAVAASSGRPLHRWPRHPPPAPLASLHDLVRINVGHHSRVLEHIIQTAEERGIIEGAPRLGYSSPRQVLLPQAPPRAVAGKKMGG
jgi:hypothetical protein